MGKFEMDVNILHRVTISTPQKYTLYRMCEILKLRKCARERGDEWQHIFKVEKLLGEE